MFAIKCSIRMSWATMRSHTADRREALSTVFASVFWFLAAFIKFMLSFKHSIWMPGAAVRCQWIYTWEFLSAIFAVIVCHGKTSWFIPIVLLICTNLLTARCTAKHLGKYTDSRTVAFHCYLADGTAQTARLWIILLSLPSEILKEQNNTSGKRDGRYSCLQIPHST